MRKLAILLLLMAVGACHPRSPWWTTTNSYYPPAAPLDSIVASVHHQYDTYRSLRHSIPLPLASSIRVAATHHSIPLPIAFSLVHVESRFKPEALSYAGAIGLTQVMPKTGLTHCSLQRNHLWEKDANLRCGFSYLRMLHNRLGDWEVALASYNVGDARRRRAPLTGEPDGSHYASLVLSLADQTSQQ